MTNKFTSIKVGFQGFLWYTFDSGHGKQWHYFDVIKIKAEKSRDLMNAHSLLCKMLALKADDRGVDREDLVRRIYQAAAEMKEHLAEDHLLLLEQWVNAYKDIPEPDLQQIKKEIGMEFIATTISEHIYHEGLVEGEARSESRGEAKGKAKGEGNGQISMLKTLNQLGIVSDEQFQSMIQPLRRKLKELTGNESVDETDF